MGLVLNPNLAAEKPNKMCPALVLVTTARIVNPNIDALRPYLGFQSTEVISHTLATTTQMAKTIYRYPLRRHDIKSRFPQANRPRLKEKVATDTFFANCHDITGATCAQVFYGITSHVINVYGMPSENGAPDADDDFLRHEGCPTILCRDNSHVQSGFRFQQLIRLYLIGDENTEPSYHPQQNMAELQAVKWLKQHTQLLLDRTGAPPMLWLLASITVPCCFVTQP